MYIGTHFANPSIHCTCILYVHPLHSHTCIYKIHMYVHIAVWKVITACIILYWVLIHNTHTRPYMYPRTACIHLCVWQFLWSLPVCSGNTCKQIIINIYMNILIFATIPHYPRVCVQLLLILYGIYIIRCIIWHEIESQLEHY